MTTTQNKTRDYQSPELVERSKGLQQEALDDKSGGYLLSIESS